MASTDSAELRLVRDARARRRRRLDRPELIAKGIPAVVFVGAAVWFAAGASSTHEQVAHRLGLRQLASPLAYTYGFDALLAPIGFVAARSGGLSFLCLLPVLAGFELLARERRSRFDALAEAARLGELAVTDALTG